MASLRRRYRNFKKAKANPYAGRGLDKFALVTAELEAKREKLAAELDTPLSMVKFAIGAHNKWVPIVLSRSTKKEIHPSRKKSAALVHEDKPALNSRAHKGGLHNGDRTQGIGFIEDEKLRLTSANGAHGRDVTEDVAQTGLSANAVHVGRRTINREDTHFSGSIAENMDMSGGFISKGTSLGDGLYKEGLSHTDSAFHEDRLHVDARMQKRRSTSGSSIVIKQEDSGEITEIFSAASEAEHRTTFEEEEEAVVLQGRNLKTLIGAIAGVPWVVSKATTIASTVVFLKWHAKSITSEGKSLSPKRESLRDAKEFHAAALSVSLSSPSLEKALVPSNILPLPSPPAPLRIPSISITPEQDDIVENLVPEDVGAPHRENANKQHRKCKVKGLLKMRSAPSTPRDSRQPKKSFTAASAHSKVLGVHDQVTDRDIKEEELLAPGTTNVHNVPIKHRFLKVSAADAQKRVSAQRAGHALAVAGLVLSLIGLAMGYFSAIIGVVCWWYVLPSLRKAVGDRPMVRSHHHSHVNNKTPRATNAQGKGKKISKEVGSGKYDLFSQEYKKKVIMEGLLDRRRRSNA